MSEQEILTSEIKQISEQYQLEVGGARKRWPKSVKERVTKLFELGLQGSAISRQTNIPYFTVLKMRPTSMTSLRRGRPRKAFKELVIANQTAQANVASVTMANNQKKLAVENVATVTVTTPAGFKIELTNLSEAIELIRAVCF